MDDNGHRENGRHKADHYKSVHAQWMIPPHQMKDSHAMKVMAIMAERDNAIQERNLALAEKKAALAERDMAILQRDAVVSERNTALMERDSALAALEYARESSINGDTPSAPRPSKHFHPHPPILSDMPYAHGRDLHATEAYPITTVSVKPKRPRKETKSQNPNAAKKACSRKGKQASSARTTTMCQWRGGNIICGGEDLKQNEWKGQDLGLNLVTFDDTTMPAPTCSCTGKLQQCYKWGSGGWQSACCTTTLSMYPLPVMANKRHARVAGRKMSGSAFTKLLSRLAAEGHDLSAPVDLRYHWAKHGTNRYITIR